MTEDQKQRLLALISSQQGGRRLYISVDPTATYIVGEEGKDADDELRTDAFLRYIKNQYDLSDIQADALSAWLYSAYENAMVASQEKFRHALQEGVHEITDDEQMHYDALLIENIDLKSRVAELGAEVDRLRASAQA